MFIRFFCFVCLAFFTACKTTTYYLVRHAEKEQSTTMMQSDPPLTAKGEKQAIMLKNYLQDKNIKTIYSTNYARTIATAEPTRLALGLTLKIYDPRKLDQLVSELKTISDGNVLVVGHSNTVDDVVNGLTGKATLSELADSEYGDVFIIKKKGSSYSFQRVKVFAEP